nr:endoplasmic reticulum-Golgi intermediate compartment protein 3 [Halyomorpha halys]
MKKHFEKLKYFDAYYKPVDDLQERTFIGGTVSILCWLTIIFLSTVRCYEFFTNSETDESIYVDTSRSSKLWINIDFIVPRISCDYIALDAMDSSGEQHLHLEHNIFKRRLDLNGTPIAEPKNEKIGMKTIVKEENKTETTTAKPVCGSCYGAEDPILNITCCNTCEEVKEAYRIRRWQIHETQIEQCKSSATSHQIQKAFKEGCQIYGYMEVNRVAGSFHVAPGQSFSINYVHVHDVQPFSSTQFNTSHIIRHLSFSRTKVVGQLNNPLDGSESYAIEGGTMFHYYLKIVPTLYVLKHGETLETNQFSVTKYEKVMSPMSGESGMPGIFFSYELSALMVKVTDKDVPISHLVTDLCSIVGGVWIVAMFIDSICYRSAKFLEKIDLGKAS